MGICLAPQSRFACGYVALWNFNNLKDILKDIQYF